MSGNATESAAGRREVPSADPHVHPDERIVGRDVPLFFGDGLFGTVHIPSGTGLPGWVICSPFGKERTNAHRLSFRWSQALAAAGYWVLRFDYRGTGDSSGAFDDFTVDDYLSDITSARNQLERISGQGCRGLLGLRLGADLAAMYVATQGRNLDLVLWEPIIDGKRYQGGLLRTAMANQMVNARGAAPSRTELRRKLESGECVLVDGFSLGHRMFQSLGEVDLASLGRPTCGNVLAVHIKTRSSDSTPAALAQLVEEYSRNGDTRLESVEEPPVWMRTRSYRWVLSGLFDLTLDWITSGQRPSSPAGPPQAIEPGCNRNPESIERPVEFTVEGSLVHGVLHEPVTPVAGLPGIILVAAGEACRAAFFYPKLARELARRGWRVLRFDPRGIGDSHGSLDCQLLTEVFRKVEGGVLVPDTRSAIEFMKDACGCQSSVLVGLCGGAITSILVAQEHRRVAGIVPLELPMRLTPSGDTDISQSLSREIPWDESLARHRGTLVLLRARRVYHRIQDLRRRLGVAVASATRRGRGHLPGDGGGWYRERIGDDASCAMLAALERTLDRRVPVLCVFADTEQPKLFEQALPGVFDRRPAARPCISYEIIRGSDHNFTVTGSAEALIGAVVSWLDSPSSPWAHCFRAPDRSPGSP